MLAHKSNIRWNLGFESSSHRPLTTKLQVGTLSILFGIAAGAFAEEREVSQTLNGTDLMH